MIYEAGASLSGAPPGGSDAHDDLIVRALRYRVGVLACRLCRSAGSAPGCRWSRRVVIAVLPEIKRVRFVVPVELGRLLELEFEN